MLTHSYKALKPKNYVYITYIVKPFEAAASDLSNRQYYGEICASHERDGLTSALLFSFWLRQNNLLECVEIRNCYQTLFNFTENDFVFFFSAAPDSLVRTK